MLYIHKKFFNQQIFVVINKKLNNKYIPYLDLNFMEKIYFLFFSKHFKEFNFGK